MPIRLWLPFAVVLAFLSACGGSDGGSSPSPSGGGASQTEVVVAKIEQTGLIDDARPFFERTSDPAAAASKFSTTFPSQFNSSFPNLKSGGDTGGIYAIVKLATGSEPGVRSAWVRSQWKYRGTVVQEHISPAVLGTWTSLDSFNGGWEQAQGDYEFVVSIVGTPETRTLAFKIGTAPKGFEPYIKPLGNAKLSELIVTDVSKPIGGAKLSDASKSSFKASEPMFLTAGFTGDGSANLTLTMSYKFAGEEYGGITRTVSLESGLYTERFVSAGSGPARGPGDYEVIVVAVATGEKLTVKFKVTPDGSPFKVDRVGMTSDSRAAEPRVETSFDAWRELNPLVTLASGNARDVSSKNGSSLRYAWSYAGEEIRSLDVSTTAGSGLTSYQPLSSSMPVPRGDYELSVFNKLTGEKYASKFSVTTDGITPTPSPTPTPRPTSTPRPLPTPITAATPQPVATPAP